MSIQKVAAGVEIKLDDGSTIKGYKDDSIILTGEGRSERDWQGILKFPKVVWDDLSVGQKLTAGTEYDAALYAAGETHWEKIKIPSMPEDVEGAYIDVECCGPDYH